MSAARLLLVFLVLAGSAVLPVAAGAAAYVPPGNSAANQYTETFPTSGGNAEAKGKGKVTAGDVLGAANAKKLKQQGEQGREAAAVVAATAPPAAATGGEGGGETRSAGGGGDGQGGGGAGSGPAAGGGSGGGTGSGSNALASAERGDGSSGFTEVLGQATGSSSSGGTGWLLPLVLLAGLIWALAFFLRRRRRTA